MLYCPNGQKTKRWDTSGTIGDISLRLGYDIRDVWMSGYSDEQISGVLIGEYTLSELWKMKPLGNTRTPIGGQILSNRRESLTKGLPPTKITLQVDSPPLEATFLPAVDQIANLTIGTPHA